MKQIPITGGGDVESGLIREYNHEIAKLLEPIADGSGSARGEGTNEGWIQGLSMARIDPLGQSKPFLSYLAHAVLDLLLMMPDDTAIHQVMVNKLEPRGGLDWHRDGPIEGVTRWHLPIITNGWVRYDWYDEHGFMHHYHMPPFVWSGPIEFTELHCMANGGSKARVHYVVDIYTEGT